MAGYRPGDLIQNRYEVQGHLCIDRFGTVLRVVDLEVGIEAALKVIHPGFIPNEEVGRLFLESMKEMLSIRHMNVASVFDVNSTEGKYYLVRQLIHGVPLSRLMMNRKLRGDAFSLDETLPILNQLVGMLSSSKHTIHGSLSPESIRILPEHLKVTDMGLAESLPLKAVWRRLIGGDRLRGYVAPELELGVALTPACDVFSLGVLLGEMLTQLTFRGQSELFTGAFQDIPSGVESIIQRALNAEPSARYKSTADFWEALADATGTPRVFAISSTAFTSKGKSGSEVKFDDDSDLDLLLEETKAFQPMPEEDTAKIAMERVIDGSPIPDKDPSKSGSPAPTPLVSKQRSSAPSPPKARKPDSLRDSQIDSVQGTRKKISIPSEQSDLAIGPKRPSYTPRESTPPPIELSQSMVSSKSRTARIPEPHRDEDKSKSEASGSDSMQWDSSPNAGVAEQTQNKASRTQIEGGSNTPSNGLQRISRTSDLAAAKLETQANLAEKESAEELLKRAEKLDGVDPRFVRAAHTLESSKRGSRSKKAAEILKQRSENLEGIDPRYLRAAARLAENEVDAAQSDALYDDADSESWRDELEGYRNSEMVSFLTPAEQQSETPTDPEVEQAPEKNGHS